MSSVNRTNLKVLFTASTATTALATDGSAPVPTSTKPSDAVDCEQAQGICFVFGGTDAADETINYRIVAWYFGSGVYLPMVVASGAATLGAMAMTVTGLDTAATLLADAITDTLTLGGNTVRSPANNCVADIVIQPGGAQFLTVDIDLGTAASASCYWTTVDEAEV